MGMSVRPPDPPLTDRVVSLRPWGEAGDVAMLTAACNDRAIAEFLDQIPSPYTEEDARAYIELCRIGWRQGSPSNFAIVEAGVPVGAIGVRWLDGLDAGSAEVGYWMSPDARGRGLCSRALRLVSRWVLEEAGALRLQLRADEVNVASNRVAEKAGFTREGVLRSSRYNARLGRRVDFVMYSLLPGEL
jgi:RimJ/RimL family protein N-acetyltransferase